MAGGDHPVDGGLRLKLRIYLTIVVIALVVVVVDVVRTGSASAVPVAVGLGAGSVLGGVASRMSALSWDAANARVVGRIDVLGAVILVGYVLLVIFRGSVLAELFDPRLVGTASVSTLAGLMLGQLLGTVGGIARVVRAVRSEHGRRAIRRS